MSSTKYKTGKLHRREAGDGVNTQKGGERWLASKMLNVGGNKDCKYTIRAVNVELTTVV